MKITVELTPDERKDVLACLETLERHRWQFTHGVPRPAISDVQYEEDSHAVEGAVRQLRAVAIRACPWLREDDERPFLDVTEEAHVDVRRVAKWLLRSSLRHGSEGKPQGTLDPVGEIATSDAQAVNNHELLTPREVSELLRVPPATLQDWRTDRTGPPFLKLGRAVRYRRADIAAFLQAQTKGREP